MTIITTPYASLPYLQAKLTVAKRMRSALPKPIPWIDVSINSLYQEIAECLLFGLNHAAIVLCGGFLEHTLRLALHERITRAQGLTHNTTPDDLTKDPVWRWLDEYFTLGSLIKEARKEGIIGTQKRSAGWWEKFPREYRNPYDHCRIFAIVRGEKEEKVFFSPAGEREETEMDAQRDRKLWGIHKKEKDERESLKLFCEVTDRFHEIATVMQWQPREPSDAEAYLAAKFTRFFTEDWDSMANAPKFVAVRPDLPVDWGVF